ncbi:hypothetical protein [Papillibacter cinnamivorans]|uniref:Uncharacterized protein n=1 Tax=Papillibacter cinnamivorans DSM 12816 TaxID=1122930 RepID=A0A1W2BIY2_9FIRM|nr:hypothetical protein [Papillibacter cinnamivorans]SMC72846.1 hypothetical protein SAMN02745168_2239 [Papillibacter cinnamivorans DSM 12816]
MNQLATPIAGTAAAKTRDTKYAPHGVGDNTPGKKNADVHTKKPDNHSKILKLQIIPDTNSPNKPITRNGALTKHGLSSGKEKKQPAPTHRIDPKTRSPRANHETRTAIPQRRDAETEEQKKEKHPDQQPKGTSIPTMGECDAIPCLQPPYRRRNSQPELDRQKGTQTQRRNAAPSQHDRHQQRPNQDGNHETPSFHRNKHRKDEHNRTNRIENNTNPNTQEPQREHDESRPQPRPQPPQRTHRRQSTTEKERGNPPHPRRKNAEEQKQRQTHLAHPESKKRSIAPNQESIHLARHQARHKPLDQPEAD